MPADLATVSAITKEVYEALMREQLNNEVPALRRIERDSSGITSNVGGKYVTFPIHYGRNSGVGSRAEYADLPKAGHQATAPAYVKLKNHYGSMELSGQALALVDSNVQAFISALDLETEGLKNDLAVNLNRQVYGDGKGTLATLGSNSTSTYNITEGMDHLGINQKVDIFTTGNLNGTGAATVSNAMIVAVSDNEDGTGTVDLVDSTGTPITTSHTGKVLVVAGSAREEWIGYDAIVNDSGTLYGVDPTDVDQWRAVVDDNSGVNRPLSEARIIQNVDKVRKRGGRTSLLLTSLGVRRSYFGLLVQQRQFVNTSQDNKKFEGGFTGLAFTTDQGEIPLVADATAPYNTLWGISEKNLKLYRDADWAFLNRDGNMWKIVPGDAGGTIKDAYMATMFQYSQIGTDRRGVHFRINDLSES